MADPNMEPHDKLEFDASCRLMAREWRLRSHDQSANRWLEERLYRLVEHIDSLDLLHDAAGDRLERLNRRGAKGRPSLTRKVLRLIFDNEANPPTSQQRARIANRIDYALWHFVPPEFLKGFLDDAGYAPKHGTVLPGYEKWLADQLRKSRNRDRLRAYPNEVRALVQTPRPRRWRERDD